MQGGQSDSLADLVALKRKSAAGHMNDLGDSHLDDKEVSRKAASVSMPQSEANYSQVGILGVRYKSAIFRDPRPESLAKPNRT